MTVINLFLTGNFHSEVMCANALIPHDFHISYKTSFLPFGIFKITQKEKSLLWNIQQNSFTQEKEKAPIIIPSINVETDRGIQISLF